MAAGWWSVSCPCIFYSPTRPLRGHGAEQEPHWLGGQRNTNQMAVYRLGKPCGDGHEQRLEMLKNVDPRFCLLSVYISYVSFERVSDKGEVESMSLSMKCYYNNTLLDRVYIEWSVLM